MTNNTLIKNINKLPDHLITHIYEYCIKKKKIKIINVIHIFLQCLLLVCIYYVTF